jgi:osmoprotectant transport system permease protein
MSRSLGFANTYALAVREDFARAQDLRSLSDLARLRVPVRAGFSYEFMDRPDGYAGLAQRYQLRWPPANLSRMEHSFTYEAIEHKAVDVIDVYSTDAKIDRFRLRVLQDDRGYFPDYQAVWVVRAAFAREHPVQWRALRQWEGKISAATMRNLNAQADLDKRSVTDIVAGLRGASGGGEGLAAQIGHRTLEHLALVGIALAFSIGVGVPLGFVATRHRRTGRAILALSAIVQTVPSMALLCFLIPPFGIGTRPALVALCLYSLLPVVLNTFSGIRAIESRHLENARAFGLTPAQILWKIQLPLASPALLSGVRTATIVSIGTATLAALVGAGGYGVPIVTGLSLNDIPTILTGAIPAAVMAWLASLGFDLLGRALIPPGLRSG